MKLLIRKWKYFKYKYFLKKVYIEIDCCTMEEFKQCIPPY